MSHLSRFVPLWLAWSGFTFFKNRFDVDDVPHRFLAFLNIFAVGAMGVSAPASIIERDAAPFSLSFALGLSCVAAMHARAYFSLPTAKLYARYWGSAFALAAGFFLVAAFLPGAGGYAGWVLGLGVILLP